MANFESSLLPNLLPIYYKRLFPYSQYYKWLSYGNVRATDFPHREFSFTLADDIYIRYQSFKDKDEMEREIQKKCPHKIDIGAIYSFRPKDHRTVSVFTPLEKELVFDIDMTDYDEVRYCCSGAEICNKCWKYMTIAVKILDAALREDFGYKHILWVYSGRRGVHCWVCDAGARTLSNQARSSLAEYLQVIRGGDSQTKKVNIPSKALLHPMLVRAEKIALKYFDELCLDDQDMLGSSDRWKKVLSLMPDCSLKDNLEQLMPQCDDSRQRWESIKVEIQNSKVGMSEQKKRIRPHLLTEIVLQLVYPRLDINVSKSINHLLKSPFCIHPKTGRVCVPFSVKEVDHFDPMTVPTISELIEEINEFDAKCSDEERKMSCYKKTSLKTSVQVFENFLMDLSRENVERRNQKNDNSMEF